MSIEELRRQIGESGVANAIVVLGGSARGEISEAESRGKIRRSGPPVDENAVAEITDLCNLGWDKLRRAGLGPSRPPDFITPAITRLLSGERPRVGASHMFHFPQLGVMYGPINRDGLEALEGHRGVGLITHAQQLSLIRATAERTSVEEDETDLTWGIARMHAPGLWDQGYTGKNIVVAHLDTGADSQHPALAQTIVQHVVFDADGVAVAPPLLPYSDSDIHGTHTAGTIVGSQSGGGQVIGMAPDAELACGTVIEGGDTVARVLSGMNWALETGARILSMSLGFKGWDDSFETVMQLLRSQQMLPVIAIGNEGANTSRSPGNYDTALSVGATDVHDHVWGLSSSEQGELASGPLICAPGSKIVSSIPGGGYLPMSGTSTATPHVAGLAALLFQAKPQATIDEVQTAIIGSCENPSGEPANRIGAGIPNSLTALELLLQ